MLATIWFLSIGFLFAIQLGLPGNHGPIGVSGLSGIDGEPGIDGLKGVKGSRGEPGSSLLMGEWGEQGMKVKLWLNHKI